MEGEGEETYRQLINALINRNDIHGIRGLFYKKDSIVYYEGARKLVDMNTLTFPYDTLEDLENKIIYYEASRGCPFNCSYCLSSTTQGVRFLKSDRVKKELSFFMEKGVIVEEGTPDEVFSSENARMQTFLGKFRQD